MKISGLIFCVMVLVPFPAVAGGIFTLMDLGKSQDAMQRVSERETEQFEKVQQAITDGVLEAGMTRKEVLELYGEPIVVVTDTEDGTERWVYKPATSTYFEGVKIYVYLSREGTVTGTKVVE